MAGPANNVGNRPSVFAERGLGKTVQALSEEVRQLYHQGASEGGECPLVVDTTTPSCGTSRFGCWVCTVVEKDRSMEAMIKNDEEKVWMAPLLELRNELDKPDDRIQSIHQSVAPAEGAGVALSFRYA